MQNREVENNHYPGSLSSLMRSYSIIKKKRLSSDQMNDLSRFQFMDGSSMPSQYIYFGYNTILTMKFFNFVLL